MTTVFDKKENCSGCGVCKAVCNQSAIVMQRDNCGFYYPKIDAKRCISCGKCRNNCHFINKSVSRNLFEKVYAVQSRDEEVLKKSQSGGAFAELAKSILNSGGAAYGAAFNDLFEVCHIRIDSVNQLHRLQGSKYVQSKTEDIFEKVKNDLDNDLKVLFSGTPCQVAALYSYLGQRRESLYTVDIVCHGVMPPTLWKEYIDRMTDKYGEIACADFRDKYYGWKSHNETFVIGGQKIKKNVYRKIFYKNILLRPSCYSIKKDRYITACKYAGTSRVSDITIGDFWGIQSETGVFKNSNLGISLCIVNTQSGIRLFERLKQNVIWEQRDISEASAKQPHLSRSEHGVPIEDVETAREMYAKKGFKYIASRYGESGIRGIYPKGIRFIGHIVNKLLKTTEVKSERREKR